MLVFPLRFLPGPSFPSLSLFGREADPCRVLFLGLCPRIGHWEAVAGEKATFKKKFRGRKMLEYFFPSFSMSVAFQALLVSSLTPQLLDSSIMSPASARIAQTLGFSNPFLFLLPLALRWSQFLLFLTSGCLSNPSTHPHACIK